MRSFLLAILITLFPSLSISDEVTKGIEGASRFAGGKGRGGDFKDV